MFNQLRTSWAKRTLSPTFYNMSKSKVKPPNILIKTEHKIHFKKISTLLNSILEMDRYTIHQLTKEEFIKSSWKDSCCLLMYNMDCDKEKNVENLTSVTLKEYLVECDGRVIFYTEKEMLDNLNHEAMAELKFIENIKETPEVMLKKYVFLEYDIFSMDKTDLVFILKQWKIHTVKDVVGCVIQQSTAFLFSFNKTKIKDMFKFNEEADEESMIKGKDISLIFRNNELGYNNDTSKNEEKNELIILPGIQMTSKLFNSKLYLNKLQTKVYGRNMVYTDTINSTQTVFTGVNVTSIKCNGLIVHAKRQLKGKGRTGNQWLSPLGCMMFSMQISIPLKSELGQKLSAIQHLVVVAFVQSIKNRMQGYNDLDLNIKWPNDIYINKRTKIGGVIINSSFWNGNFKITIGLGVNISNEVPTDCLNSLIRHHNMQSMSNLNELEIEDVLAGTVNNIEWLVDSFQEHGIGEFKKIYYKYWMHSNAEVTLECRNNKKVRITGIDDFGYLIVRFEETGEELSLQPDGNSFDMMKNMIILK